MYTAFTHSLANTFDISEISSHWSLMNISFWAPDSYVCRVNLPTSMSQVHLQVIISKTDSGVCCSLAVILGKQLVLLIMPQFLFCKVEVAVRLEKDGTCPVLRTALTAGLNWYTGHFPCCPVSNGAFSRLLRLRKWHPQLLIPTPPNHP